MRTLYVIDDWQASYDAPISLDEGEEIQLTEKTENWGGHVWIWAKNRSGREGWIPDTLFRRTGTKAYSKVNYSAQELTCHRGEVLQAINETHGWVLCKNTNGQVGWVPAENLRNNFGSQEA